MEKKKNCTVEPNQQSRNIQRYNLYGVGLAGGAGSKPGELEFAFQCSLWELFQVNLCRFICNIIIIILCRIVSTRKGKRLFQ